MSDFDNLGIAAYSEDGNKASDDTVGSSEPSVTEFVERMLSQPSSFVPLVHPAITRIKSEHKIQTTLFTVHPNQRPGTGTTSHDTNERKQRRLHNFLWKRKATISNGIEPNIDDLILQAPSIEYSKRKKNPTGPYGIGLSIPGEIERSNDLSRILSSEDMTACLLQYFTKDESGNPVFTTFVGRNLRLSDINLLKNYQHLRYIYLAKNRIMDMKPFQQMEHLLLVDLDKNLIICNEKSGDIPEIPSLEILSLSGNRFTQIGGLPNNKYSYLNLNFNQIKSLGEMNFLIFSNLVSLEIRANRIKNLGNFFLPNLKYLWAAENELTSLGELKGCPALISFHARGNQITQISNFPIGLSKFDYINLRDNGIDTLTSFQFLGCSPIKAMILIGNPCRGLNNYREELKACIPTLIRLDKTLVPTCDLEAARFLQQGQGDGTLLPFVDHNILSLTPTASSSPLQTDYIPLLTVEKDPIFWKKIHTDPPRNVKLKRAMESEVFDEIEDIIETTDSGSMRKKKHLSLDKCDQIRDGVQKLSL